MFSSKATTTATVTTTTTKLPKHNGKEEATCIPEGEETGEQGQDAIGVEVVRIRNRNDKEPFAHR
jgi:hypothetical protein